MHKTRKPPPKTLADKALARRRARALVALCIIAGPLALLWRTLLDYAVFPPDFLMAMRPWRVETGLAMPVWNALIWDSLGQYFPWRDFAAQTIRGGTIPLWNPYQFCGNPFLANGQSALFYPLNAIFWLGDVRRAFGLSMWLHLVLAGGFAYLFLRALRLGRFGALVGGLAYSLNGYFLTWLYLPTIVNSAVWLPLALLFAEKYYRRRRLHFAAGAGLAIGLSALAGHPQIFLLCASFFGIYFVLRGISLRAYWRTAAGLALAAGFALLLAGVQLLPLVELLAQSHRTSDSPQQGYAFYLLWALPWANVATLFAPDFFGNPSLRTFWGKGNYAEYCTYAGILPLGLALVGAFFRRGFHALFFAAAGAACLLCAFGTALNWPIYHLLPGMSRAGSPSRLLLLYLTSVAMLAGLGADWVARNAAGKAAQGLRVRLLGAILGFAVLAMAALFFAKATVPPLPDLSTASALADAKPNLVVLAVVLAAALLIVFTIRPHQKSIGGWVAAAVVLLVVGDLVVFGHRYLRFSPRAEVYPATASIEFLAARTAETGGRVLAVSPLDIDSAWPPSELPAPNYLMRGMRRFPKALLPPNAASVYAIRDILGYDSLYLAEYRALVGELEGRDPSPLSNGNMLLAADAKSELLGLFGVRYLASVAPLEAKGLRLVHDGDMKIYKVANEVGRAWTTTGGFSPDEAYAEAPLLEDGINHVSISANLAAPGHLVLADGYYPGWQAFVDGRRLEIVRANRAFRAVPLEAGSHRVDFYFRPTSFKAGLFGFLLAFSIIAAWATAGNFAAKRGS